MFALVLESPKIVALYLLIGVTILMSHFGRKPEPSKKQSRRTDVGDVSGSSPGSAAPG